MTSVNFRLGADYVRHSSHGEHYWLIPGNQGLRWIVPSKSRMALFLLHQWRPYHWKSQVKWHLLLAAYRAGTLGSLPGVTSASFSVDFDALGWSGSGTPSALIYIGTPGLSQKMVATLTDGQTTQVAKIPLVEGAKAKICQEAKSLEILEKEKPGIAPRLLALDSKRAISLQEAIAGKLAPPRITPSMVNYLTGLRTERKIPLGEGWVPEVWVHGDFAPWNLKCLAHQTVAIDWEETYPGLPLVDLLHFHLKQTFLFTREPAIERFFASSSVQNYLDLLRITQAQQRLLLNSALNALRRQWGDSEFGHYLAGVL